MHQQTNNLLFPIINVVLSGDGTTPTPIPNPIKFVDGTTMDFVIGGEIDFVA